MDITTALLDRFFLLRNQRQQQEGVRFARRAGGMRLDTCLSGI